MGFINDLLDTGGDLTFELAIMCVIAGVAIAILIMLFNSKYGGAIVRKLSSMKVRTAEEALSLTEMGIRKQFWYGFALRNRSSLRKYIKIANEEESVTGRKLDLKKARFYLPIEKEEKALVIYGDKEPNVLLVIISAMVLFAVIILAAMAIPAIVSAMAAI